MSQERRLIDVRGHAGGVSRIRLLALAIATMFGYAMAFLLSGYIAIYSCAMGWSSGPFACPWTTVEIGLWAAGYLVAGALVAFAMNEAWKIVYE